MKKAMLAVSFGTSYDEAEEKCIRPVEEALRRAFPEYEVRRAYTSRMIVRKLRGQGRDIACEKEAIAALRREGFERIAAVSTHMLHGGEYEKLLAAAGEEIDVSEALLETEEDLDWMAALLKHIAAEEGRPLLMMGHGTEHAANATYVRLREKLSADVFLACVEGEHSLERLLPELEERLPEKKLALMPLMLVAGDHAHNDMAGDDEGSWKRMLEARGFDLTIRMQGLGALEQVQQRFVEKAGRMIGRWENGVMQA